MVSSLLGSQMTAIQNAISQTTGLLPAVAGQILALATPMVMGYISKMFVGQKMDQAGLTSLPGARSKMTLRCHPIQHTWPGNCRPARRRAAVSWVCGKI